jgi:archaeal cell division control protein 6
MVSRETCPRIIMDDAVLREDYIPPDLLTCHANAAAVSSYLDGIEHGHKPLHLWLYGSPGSGKTAVARVALARMEHEHGISYVVVDCWERRTLYDILDQLIADLKVFRAEEHRVSVKLDRLRRWLGTRALVILLDEVDKIAAPERARVLYGLNSVGNTGLVCISADLESFNELEDPVRSRLNPRLVRFPSYQPKELVDLLANRAQLALAPDGCSLDLLTSIAGVSNGDARVAIQGLRRAAEEAERQCRDRITEDDVLAVSRDAQSIKVARVMAGLTVDHRMIRDLAIERGPSLSTDLWQAYQQRCHRHDRRPVALRTFSDYLNDLVRLELLAAERARVKGNVRSIRPVS